MGRILKAALAVSLVLAFVALACGPGLAPTQPLAVEKTAPASVARPAWEQDWERTLAEAKKEGKVVVYTGYGSEWRAAMSEGMRAKYGIIVDVLSGKSAEIGERLLREQRARTYVADVVVIGSSQFSQILQPEGVLEPLDKVLVLPEVNDPRVWWNGQFPYLDPEGKTGFHFYAYVKASVTINTDLVKPGDLKSWKDMLNPRWKGKILLDDPTIASGGQKAMVMLAYGILDWDFIRDLIRQEPVIQRDQRLLVEWIARGKYPFSINGSAELMYNFTKEGAPMKLMVPAEGAYLISGTGNVYLPKGAQQPDAAKVFINFLLSKEGQTLSSRATGHQSSRNDVPTDHLDAITVRQPGGRYLSSLDQEFFRKEAAIVKRVVEMFKPLVSF